MRRHDQHVSHESLAEDPRPAPPLRYSLGLALAILAMMVLLLSPVGLVLLAGLTVLSLAAFGL